MCGICGYIGKSNEPEVTYKLMTALFDKTDIRGEDAAGCWGPVVDEKVIYHKEPIKSSLFVRGDIWKQVGELHPNLLLCHARQASMGVGVPSINKNNHPFISQDGTIGLIHNGRIPDVEYKALKKRYPITSNCDSEILLRLFEGGKYAPIEKTKEFCDFDPDVASRLTGMKDIWSFLSLGHMAVAVGETQAAGVRRLWLFRNKHRSLWLADLRKSLGQVFFFSVPTIWRDALNQLDPEMRSFLTGSKLVELPTEEIWLFTISPEQSLTKRSALKRFEVCASGHYTAFDEEKIACPIPTIADTKRIALITGLGEDDKLPDTYRPPEKSSMGFHGCRGGAGYGGYAGVSTPTPVANNAPLTKYFGGTTPRDNTQLAIIGAHGTVKQTEDNMNSNGYPLTTDDIHPDEIEALCDSIREIAEGIKTTFTNQLLEGSVSSADFADLKQALEQAELDLTGTSQIASRTVG